MTATPTFQSIKDMTDAVKPAATVLSDRVSVTNPGAVTADVIDRLVWTAVFGGDAELKGTARWMLRGLAAAAGIRPASIHDLYIISWFSHLLFKPVDLQAESRS